MDPGPQGTVLVSSPPRGAGRRGRDHAKYAGGYDWDIIVEFARMMIASRWWVHVPHVPHGSVANLRERYPDCAFLTHAVHLRQRPASPESEQKIGPTKVCDVYVRAGEDEQRPDAE